MVGDAVHVRFSLVWLRLWCGLARQRGGCHPAPDTPGMGGVSPLVAGVGVVVVAGAA